MLTTKQAAAYLGISYEYLRNMRHGMLNHSGPDFVYTPAKCTRDMYRYAQAELDRWRSAHPARVRRKMVHCECCPHRGQEREV